MKKALLIAIIFSGTFLNPGFARESKIQLQLKEGQTILYSFTRRNLNDYRPTLAPFINESDEKWDIELEVTKKMSESKFIISACLKRFVSNDFANKRADIHFDSMYPPIPDEHKYLKFPTIFYETLCSLRLKMGLDTDKNELIILDREPLRKQISLLLSENGLNSREVETNTKGILLHIESIHGITDDYLLRFNNSFFQEKELALIGKKDYIVKRSDKYLKLSKQETIVNDGKTEEHSSQSLLDPQNGLLVESVSKIFRPSVANENGRLSKSGTEERLFFLIRNSETGTGQITINGHIKDPASNNIQVEVLNAPCGTQADIYEATLDNANRFSITIPLQHENIIFLRNDESLRKWINPPVGIYAEPGDHIDFELEGKGDSASITHKGDRIAENKLLGHRLRNASVLLFGLKGRSIPMSIDGNNFYKSFNSHFRLVNSPEYISDDSFPEISERGKLFLKNEAEMQRLLIACNLMSILHFVEGLEENEELLQEYYKMQQFIDNFKISNHFQEHGYFSRMAITYYSHLLFQQNLKYASPLSLKINYSKNHLRYQADQYSLYQKIHYMESILAGAALVQGKINLISDNLNSGQRHNKYDRRTWFEMQKKTGDEIIATSNNTELNTFLRNELTRAEELYSEKIYARKIFLTPAGDSVSIDDFRGKKPCIVAITNNWGTYRYFFDDISTKYPDINAIIINQGDDFEEWKNYLKRADPKAIQLFKLTGKDNLEKLFLNYQTYNNVIVFDKTGKLLDYEADVNMIESYIKKAQNPPKEKKEIDKSTMLGIIWILGGSLFLLLVAFLLFKFRMKQRLKKQIQEKRLRELQMAAIRAQMNPHFLFNSLNSVQNLIQQNRAREAHLYLSDFAGLIRKVLRNSDKEEVSLDEELEMLEQYLKLEQLRFDFEYHIEVDSEIDKSLFMLPSMILQPLAENALMHGLQNKNGDKKLLIRISKIENAIQITVEDNGIGIQEAQKLKTKSNGIGLRMNEERIQMMKEKYGGNYSFRIIDLFAQGDEGTRVEMIIPEEI